MIPSKLTDQGEPLERVLSRIEAGIRTQCGGELCLALQVEERDENFETCEFVRTEPPQDAIVPRGSTVVVVAGTKPCTETTPEETETETEVPPETETATEVPPETETATEVPPATETGTEVPPATEPGTEVPPETETGPTEQELGQLPEPEEPPS